MKRSTQSVISCRTSCRSMPGDGSFAGVSLSTGTSPVRGNEGLRNLSYATLVATRAAALTSAIIPGQALLFRRGPFSGPGFQPAADLRFRREERVRVDVPLAAPVDSVSARVLDRRGGTLAVPATALQREEKGVRLASAEVNLAPLTSGDYLVEVSVKRGANHERVLTAIRIVSGVD